MQWGTGKRRSGIGRIRQNRLRNKREFYKRCKMTIAIVAAFAVFLSCLPVSTWLVTGFAEDTENDGSMQDPENPVGTESEAGTEIAGGAEMDTDSQTEISEEDFDTDSRDTANTETGTPEEDADTKTGTSVEDAGTDSSDAADTDATDGTAGEEPLVRAGVSSMLYDLMTVEDEPAAIADRPSTVNVDGNTYELQDAFLCWVYGSNGTIAANYGTWLSDSNGISTYDTDYLTDVYSYEDTDGVWCLIPVDCLLYDSIHNAEPTAYLAGYTFNPNYTTSCPFKYAPNASSGSANKTWASYVYVAELDDDADSSTGTAGWYVQVYDTTSADTEIKNSTGKVIHRSNLYYQQPTLSVLSRYYLWERDEDGTMVKGYGAWNDDINGFNDDYLVDTVVQYNSGDGDVWNLIPVTYFEEDLSGIGYTFDETKDCPLYYLPDATKDSAWLENIVRGYYVYLDQITIDGITFTGWYLVAQETDTYKNGTESAPSRNNIYYIPEAEPKLEALEMFYIWVHDENGKDLTDYNTQSQKLTDVLRYTDSDRNVWHLIPADDCAARLASLGYSLDSDLASLCTIWYYANINESSTLTRAYYYQAESDLTADGVTLAEAGTWYLVVQETDSYRNSTDVNDPARCSIFYYTDTMTVEGIQPEHTTINLFDYWLYDDAQNRYHRDTDESEDNKFNGGINNGHTLKFSVNGTNFAGTGQSLYNQPYNYWTGTVQPYSGIVQNVLVGGYPYLASPIPTLSGEGDGYFVTQESLAYLFDPTDTQEGTGRQSYTNVTNLLQEDEDGYYYYDCTQNYAEFDEETNSFILYASPAAANGTVAAGSFFPFNAYDDVRGLTSPANEILNHYFALTLTTSFTQQYGGKTGTSSSSGDTTFEFSGDDDVWIFIDGVLVADLGGIHDATSVTINFATGNVVINEDTSYETSTTLYDAYYAAGQEDVTVWSDDVPATYADDTHHTLTMYYMERGNGASNLIVKYNIQEVPETAIYKVDEYGDPMGDVDFAAYRGYCDTTAGQDASAGTYYYIFDSTDTDSLDTLLGIAVADADDFNVQYAVDGTTVTAVMEKATSVSAKLADGVYIVDDSGNIALADAEGKASTTIITAYYMGATDEDGRMVFVHEDGSLYSLKSLQLLLGDSFLLRELSVPEGYRKVSSDIYMRFTDNYEALVCENTYTSGVWVSTDILVSAPDELYAYTSGQDVSLIPYYTTDADTGQEVRNGTLFGIILKYVGSGMTADSAVDAYSTTDWAPIYGSSLDGYTLVTESDFITNAITAALAEEEAGYSDAAFTDSGTASILLTMTNTPGSLDEYYQALSDEDAYQAKYTVAFFWTTASSLKGATKDNTSRIIAESVSTGDNTSSLAFHYTYGALIEVPNITNEVHVQKLDENRQLVNGAQFAMYEVEEINDEDAGKQVDDNKSAVYYIARTRLLATGDGTGYTAEAMPDADGDGRADPVYFHLVMDDDWANYGTAQLKGAEAADYIYEIQTVAGDDGASGAILVWQKDISGVGAGQEAGYLIEPVQTHTTVSASASENHSGTDGTATFTALTPGEYYIREIAAPDGYAINPTETMVLVTDEAVYANAGEADNNVEVGRSPGQVVSTLSELAIYGNVDNTLTWIKDKLQVNTSQCHTFAISATSDAGYWTNADATDSASAVTAYRYQADNLYIPYEPDAAVADDIGGTGALFTDEGWSYLEIYQNSDPYEAEVAAATAGGGTVTYEYTTLTDAISTLFSQNVYIRVTDDPITFSFVKIDGDDVDVDENGIGNALNAERLSGVTFTLYEAMGMIVDTDGQDVVATLLENLDVKALVDWGSSGDEDDLARFAKAVRALGKGSSVVSAVSGMSSGDAGSGVSNSGDATLTGGEVKFEKTAAKVYWLEETAGTSGYFLPSWHWIVIVTDLGHVYYVNVDEDATTENASKQTIYYTTGQIESSTEEGTTQSTELGSTETKSTEEESLVKSYGSSSGIGPVLALYSYGDNTYYWPNYHTYVLPSTGRFGGICIPIAVGVLLLCGAGALVVFALPRRKSHRK